MNIMEAWLRKANIDDKSWFSYDSSEEKRNSNPSKTMTTQSNCCGMS
jgi:hypothetical protein